MKPGDYIIMRKQVKQKYATQYCKEAGIYLGGICLYFKKKNDTTVVLRVGDKDTEFGIGFLEEHFEKSIRSHNLEKLGI